MILARLGGLLLTGLSLFPSARPQELSAKIDEDLKWGLERKLMPGAVVAVAQKGKILLVKGYGQARLEGEVPMKEDTLFPMGTMTHLLAATAALILKDAGKLSLEDPVTKFLPECQRWKNVEIQHLLKRSSGFPGFRELHQAISQNRSPEEILKALLAVEPEAEPDVKRGISQVEYFLLALVIERCSGVSFAEFLKTSVLDPLGMTSTRLEGPPSGAGEVATGYARRGDAWEERKRDSGSIYAGGQAVSTARDLLKLDLGIHGGKLLKEESVRAMTTLSPLKGKERGFWGLGYRILNPQTGRICCSGLSSGFNHHLLRLQDREISVVVLLNSEGTAPEMLAQNVARMLLQR